MSHITDLDQFFWFVLAAEAGRNLHLFINSRLRQGGRGTDKPFCTIGRVVKGTPSSVQDERERSSFIVFFALTSCCGESLRARLHTTHVAIIMDQLQFRTTTIDFSGS